ncbi:MAG: hypothetical protein ACK4UN_02960 [Limisphaerales bacterium]
MKRVLVDLVSSRGVFAAIFSGLVLIAPSIKADQVEMKNGDRYSGKIVTMDNDQVLLQSEMLGTLRIRRDNVASIAFGAQPVPQAAPAAPNTTTNSPLPKAPPVPQVSASSAPNPQIDPNSSVGHHLATNPELVNEIRSQVLAGAGPKAAMKYDSLVEGLSSGNLNLADIQKEAAAVAAQLRQLRGSEDEETAEIFDEYLSILDSFIEATKAGAPTQQRPNAAKPGQTFLNPPNPQPASPEESLDQ